MALEKLRNCLRDQSAVSFAEYALILAIIAAGIAVAAYTLGNQIAGKLGGNNSSNANATFNNTGPTHPTFNPGVRPGQAAFIKPEEMRVGRWYPIQFVAGPDLKAIAEESEELPLTPPRHIFVSRRMRVTLLPDQNFEIRPKSATVQNTGADLTQTWQWDVKPLASGIHTLIAQVDVLQRGSSGQYVIFNRYSRRVSVRVGVGAIQQVIDDIGNARSIGDALTSLLKSWRATLVALCVLIGAFAGVVIEWRRLRKQFPQGKSHSKNDTVPNDDR